MNAGKPADGKRSQSTASQDPLLIAVMGPTASGKTPLAEAIAEALGAQLLNADAFQVYRGLDIGTAKPERKELYRLLGLKEPTENFGVGEFVQLALGELEALFEEGKSAVVVGGTGLYIRALFEDYRHMAGPPDPELRAELVKIQEKEGVEALAERLREKDPEAAGRIDLRNPARVRRALERALSPGPSIELKTPNFRRLKLGLDLPRETLAKRVDSRLEQMVQNGWIAEVRRLMDGGVPREAPGLRAIGYRALYDYLQGALTLEAATEGIRTETRQYAKRQRTWLRSEPGLHWVQAETAEHAFQAAMRLIEAA